MTRLRKVRSYLVLIYTMALLGIFPLIMHNRYFDLTKTKYYFFTAVTIVVTVCVVILSLLILFNERNFISDTLTSAVYNITMPDFFLISFLIVTVCSSFNSSFRTYAITGKEGRYIGLILLLACGAAYFIISRLAEDRFTVLYVFCLAGCIVFLLGIGQHFGIDPLKIQNGLDNSDKAVFYSTIGNRNVLSSFIVMVIGISTVMYCFEKSRRKLLFYLITTFLGFMALLFCDSDSGYIAIAILFYAIPFFYKREGFSILKFLTVLNLFFISAKLSGFLYYFFPPVLKEINIVQELLFYNNYLYIIIAILIILEIILLYRSKYYITASGDASKFIIVWGVSGILAIIAIVGSLLWFSLADKTTNLGQASTYLRFDKSWGSGRGEVWIESIDRYMGFQSDHLLIGKGPDTAALILNPNYFFQLKNPLVSYFDNCHNEYLQYLITVGLLGLLSYIGFLISLFIKLFNKKICSPSAIACGVSILCYAGQAIVNINQSITTPIVFTIAAIGMGTINYKKVKIMVKMK